MSPQPSEITDAEDAAIESVSFDSLTGATMATEDVETAPKKKPAKKKAVIAVSPADQKLDGTILPEAPEITSPEWHDYAIRHLSEDEKDADGNPYVHGLRRITELLIGPILSSKAHVVQPPRFNESIGTMLHPATVEYTLKILYQRAPDGIDPYEIEYTDVADVYFGNTDPTYARFPTAMAATRAEGRCYRKLLRLKRIAASEEMTEVPLNEAGLNGNITPTQTNFIDLLCKRLKINVMSYINLGTKKYSSIDEVSYASAQKMTEHLCTLQNDPSKIVEEIKGYKLDWMM